MAIPTSLVVAPKRRPLFSIPYQRGAVVSRWSPDVPRMTFARWILRLEDATLNKVGSTSQGTVLGEAPFTLVKEFVVKAGGDTVKSAPGRLLRADGYIFDGIAPTFTSPTNGNTNDPITFDFPLYFERPRAVMTGRNPNGLRGPELCYLPGGRYDSMEVQVHWGTEEDLVSGGNYSTKQVNANTKLVVYGDVVDDPRLARQRFLLNKQKVKTVSNIATETREEKLPVGESIHGLLISQYTDAAGVVSPVTNIVADTARVRVTVNNDSATVVDDTWGGLRNQSRRDYGLYLPDGMIFIDFLPGGDFMRSLRADRPDIQSVEVSLGTTAQSNARLAYVMYTVRPGR